MEAKFVYRLYKLFQEWRKSSCPIARFELLDQIDNLIQAELVRCLK